ncbi:WD40 repeat-like protein [Ceratobasidium sp. AG-I]|nr:WD40 repeat-like protein [Ceratobasidium sp. AG-I]
MTRIAAPLQRWHVGSWVNAIAVSHDGTRVASGSYDNLVRIWYMHTGSLVLRPLEGHTDFVRSVAWSHDDTRLISGSDDKTIRIWDTHTGAPIGDPLRGHTDWVMSVVFSPDSTRIVSGSLDTTIRFWNARTRNTIGNPLNGHEDGVNSIVFSSDSTRIASGSYDRTIRIWDARTGAPIGEPLRGHTASVLSVAFSYDCTRIVSGSNDSTICIWNAVTCALIGEPLRGHTSDVNSVAFSHDSTRIVSGSSDSTIHIWDACTGVSIGESLMGHTGLVRSVAFSPYSTRIVSGSHDNTIYIWEAPESTLSFDMVTSDMSAQEMFDALVKHECPDLSLLVDPTRYSKSAIASGGFGDVWQAWMRDGTLVAVKCLRLHIILQGDPKAMKRTTRELYHWSKARHENIQELLGVVMFQGRLGMVSRWMHNGNLQQYIQKNPSIERYPLCVQVTKGVAYLHEIGMVHGDLKAVNILVSATGTAKISDFDYSILSESTLRFSETTKTGGGTLRWMAPELALHGEDDESPPVSRNTKTDIYALGMTILEIMSGDVPYHYYQRDVTIYGALNKRQPPKCPQVLSEPDGRSSYVWNLLLACWDHDPSARPDASSILASLQRFMV